MAKVALVAIEGELEEGIRASYSSEGILRPEESLIMSRAINIEELSEEMDIAGGIERGRYPIAWPNYEHFATREVVTSYRQAVSKIIAGLFLAELKNLKTFDAKTLIVNDSYIPHGIGDYFIDSGLFADSGAVVQEILDPCDPQFEELVDDEKGGLTVLKAVLDFIEKTKKPNDGLAHLRRFLLPIYAKGQKVDLSDIAWDGERTHGQRYRKDVYAERLDQLEKSKETIILSGKNEALFYKLLEVFKKNGGANLLIGLHDVFKKSARFNIGPTGFYSYQKNLGVLQSRLWKHLSDILGNNRFNDLSIAISNLISCLDTSQNYEQFAGVINNFVQKTLPELAGAKETEMSEVTTES